MHRDQQETGTKLGQNLRDTFHRADVFFNAANTDQLRVDVERFLDLVFGTSIRTPTRDEFGMFHAQAAALRSADLKTTWNLWQEVRMNLQGYVRCWELVEKPEGRSLDYAFTSDSKAAATWPSKDEADIDCRLFDRQHIRIPSSLGGFHICSGFKSEERPDGKFIVYCEAPFIRQA